MCVGGVQVLVLVLSRFLRTGHPLAVACEDVLRTSSPLLQNEVQQVYSQLTTLLAAE
jgi:hypothetical protein